jgi:thiamine biosynthesis lipoprotein
MPEHLRFFPLVALLTPLLACTPAPEHQVLELQGATMGTSYSIQVVDLPSGVDPNALRDRITKELDRVNALMSTYRESSELSGFNRSRSTDWIPVSPELATLVKEAIWTSEVSDGAFDTTVGPLVNLWGFGPGKRTDTAPTDDRIAQARAHVGYHKLSVRQEPPALRKSDPDLYLDLSAIAKGYGVDRVAELLEKTGITDYLVEIGGELRGHGHNGRGQPWRIAVERPDPGVREVERVVELRGGAMATSGDYRNFFEQGGKLYSHTIDPTTGRPVTHDLASVTVLAPRTAKADALATALLVLGPKAGPALAESLGIPALFILRTPDGYEERQSGTFDSHLATAPASDSTRKAQ